MMVTIKKVGLLSLGKVLGVVYALLGLILGLFIMVVSLSGYSSSTSLSLYGPLFGIGAIILLPVFYGAMGFISGIILAFFYNLVSRWVGGIEVEV